MAVWFREPSTPQAQKSAVPYFYRVVGADVRLTMCVVERLTYVVDEDYSEGRGICWDAGPRHGVGAQA